MSFSHCVFIRLKETSGSDEKFKSAGKKKVYFHKAKGKNFESHGGFWPFLARS